MSDQEETDQKSNQEETHQKSNWEENRERREFVRTYKRAGRWAYVRALFLLVVGALLAFGAILCTRSIDLSHPIGIRRLAITGFVACAVLALVSAMAAWGRFRDGLDLRSQARDARDPEDGTKSRGWLIFMTLLPILATALMAWVVKTFSADQWGFLEEWIVTAWESARHFVGV